MKQLLLLVVVVLLVAAAFSGPAAAPPDKPLISVAGRYVLVTYPLAAKPDYLDGESFATFKKPRLDDSHYRAVIDGTTFAADLPVFQKMEADRTCKDEASITIGDGKKIIDSKPLPATEAATEKFIGKYVK